MKASNPALTVAVSAKVYRAAHIAALDAGMSVRQWGGAGIELLLQAAKPGKAKKEGK